MRIWFDLEQTSTVNSFFFVQKKCTVMEYNDAAFSTEIASSKKLNRQ